LKSFKITISYDGGPFVGWQRQAEGPSIQGLIEDALTDLEGQHVTVNGAGRTDAGVHAIGQVANFTLTREIEPEVVVRSLNAKLPIEIRVRSADVVPASFNARFHARTKSYRYRLWNADVLDPFERAYAWHVTAPLDVAAMAGAARMLEGHHDFAAFQAGSERSATDRVITRSVLMASDRGLVTYDVSGNGFLRHMVRTIVGTLIEIGRGRRPPEWIRELIASRDRAQSGRTAPAHGLFLVRVDYGVVQFEQHVP